MSELIDPKDFIITRKRKKYKFAKFHNAPNCFEFDEWRKRPVASIEIGAGTGLFSLELAKLHPEKHFVAIDVKADRLQHGAYKALEEHVDNISFVRARADQIDQLFDNHSIESIWVTFADPFPKKRSAGRRLTHEGFLAKYELLLASNGALYMKHDNRDFFCFSLEQLVANNWRIEELSFDLHDSSLPDEYKIMTTYERRWLAEGGIINFVKGVKQ